MQSKNSANQKLMLLRALFLVKWFAEANKKISAYTPQAQDEFFATNLRFRQKSFRFLAALNRMASRHKTGQISVCWRNRRGRRPAALFPKGPAYSRSTLIWSVPWASNSPMYCSMRSITSS